MTIVSLIQKWIQAYGTAWVLSKITWTSPGPWFDRIGVALVVMSVLQLLPETWAGGRLFDKKTLWITLILDAMYLFIVLVFPFINGVTALGIIGILLFAVLAVLAHKRWH